MTLKEWLKQGEEQLRGSAHPDRARRDAELLLMHLLQLERAALLARWDTQLSAEKPELYLALLKRRATGEPIQYITGETEFYGLPFRVTPDVLIPRPETEHLVEKVVELLPLFSQPRIVDVGTGSGAIAIALAHEWPNAVVTAIDVSSSALELARENATRIGFADRIRFLNGDLLTPVATEQFDIVASNPPYVPEADRASLSVEVRDHEPATALFSGDDGLDLIRKLIPQAFAVLAPGGALLMEFGYGQWPAIKTLLEDSGFQQIDFIPDLQSIPRIAVGRRP